MPQDTSDGTPQVFHHFRFPPPAAGGSPKTGWEALDKWVGSGGNNAGVRDASAPKGTTGWEALDKWVPARAAADGGGSAAASSAAPPATATAAPAAADAPAAAAGPAAAGAGGASGGGFWASLKRIFGG